MIGFEPISESSTIYQIILAVNYLRPIVIEDDYAVQNVTGNLCCAHAHFSFDFSMMTEIHLLGYFHLFEIEYIKLFFSFYYFDYCL